MASTCSWVQPFSSSTPKKPSLRICGTEELSPGMIRILSPGTMPEAMKRFAVSAPMPSLSPLTEATACSATVSMTRSNMTNGMPESASFFMVVSRVLSWGRMTMDLADSFSMMSSTWEIWFAGSAEEMTLAVYLPSALMASAFSSA